MRNLLRPDKQATLTPTLSRQREREAGGSRSSTRISTSGPGSWPCLGQLLAGRPSEPAVGAAVVTGLVPASIRIAPRAIIAP